ncbi:MAG: FkbM family methyltransferase [Nanoarchaeota archaeon]|nr:FkbM family methyltransferase [Nanoarchaeota archaeon]
MKKEINFNWLKNQAKNAKSKHVIEQTEKDHNIVFKKGEVIKGKELSEVILGKYKIWLRRNSSPSSIEIYYEIFKDKDHTTVRGFSGKGNKVVIDTGANEGFYTLKIKEDNPNCKVIAIEANPAAFLILKKNVKSNKLRDVILVNKALGKNNENICFEYVDEITAIGSKSLRNQKRPWLNERRIKQKLVKSIDLPHLCKSHQIKEVDILKIDVEGMEMEILKNSKSVLGNVKKIVVEWHSKKLRDDIKHFLKSQGFKLILEEKRNFGNLYFIKK